MTSTTGDIGHPVEFDPFSDEFFNDPTEVYRRLRDEAPVWFSEKYGFYALSRFADVLAAHRDWEGFSSAHGIELFSLSKDPEEIATYRQLIMMDPPEHERFRALVSRVFTPKAVTSLEPMIREVINGYLDPFNDADEFDVVADFSAPFPADVISRMLGAPEGDHQQLRHWLDDSLVRTPGQLEPSQKNAEAILNIAVYWSNLIAEKRAHPGDDMLTRLTEVTVDRGDGEQTRLDDEEITGFAILLGGAGAETVTKLVGNAAVLFARHPDQWQKILDDGAKIPRAVDEILRYYPPSQYQGRFSTRETVLDGGTVPAGFPVLLITGAATRDERAFENPDHFDVERNPGITIGFGHGVHSCLGAALARLESRIAIEEIAKRWKHLDVNEGGLRRVNMSNVAGYSNVPVRAVRWQMDDLEAIRQLKARYFRTMDTKDWAGMRAVFTDDVVVDTSESGGGVISGADEFMAFLSETLAAVVTVHHGHMPEIAVTSSTTATGIWAMEDMLRWPNGMELHGYGHYHETYVKTGADWRIASTTLTRLRADFTSPAE